MLDKKKIEILCKKIEEKNKTIAFLTEELHKYKALESAMITTKEAYEKSLAEAKQAKQECDNMCRVANVIVRDLKDIVQR